MSFFDKLFRKQRKVVMDVATAPLTKEQLNDAVEQPMIQISPSQLVVGTGQSVGKQRDHNEDTLFALSAILADGGSQVPFGVFIIADGMGGHQYGEVASGVAARAMAESIVKKLYSPLLGSRPESQSESLQEIMESGVLEAQQAVTRKAPGGGTTLTSALVIGEQITFAHVGDSRAYFVYPHGEVEVLTQDHSLVNRLIQLGQLTKEEAAVHPQKNILYRAIGQNDPFHPDVKNLTFPKNCTLMLCSDGLWGVIKEEEIPRIIYSSATLTEACHLLVEAANAAGGPDNISVILIQHLE